MGFYAFVLSLYVRVGSHLYESVWTASASEHEIHVARYALSPPGCSIMWNHSATLIPLLTPLIDICALPSHTWTYMHVRRSALVLQHPSWWWMLLDTRSELGKFRQRGRRWKRAPRFYDRKGDLRYFREDKISKEIKSSWLWLRSFYITSIALSGNYVLR